MAENLTMQNVTVAERTRFDRNNQAVPMVVVTYYLGSHGPFTLEYKKSEYNYNTVLADVDKVRQNIAPLLGA